VTLGRRRTKIVCTIGPATSSREMLDQLVDSGMDAARLNFSHGSHEDHAESALLIREAQARAGRPLALIADLQGPKLRIGDLPGTVVITNGDEVVLSGDGTGEPGDLPVSPPVLAEVLVPGQDVLIDDGLVHLQVEEVRAGRARCKVAVGERWSRTRASTSPGRSSRFPR
jgi:pyruvate kinase